MNRRVWLASYPKSGNTWFRLLIGALTVKPDAEFNINETIDSGGIASSRAIFDNATLIDSGLLTHDEIDQLRPAVYRLADARSEDDEDDAPWFMKVHDAYTINAAGEALLGGAEAAKGAIVIVRDPRDVAPSLANHNGVTIDDAIESMSTGRRTLAAAKDRLGNQLRQIVLDWSGHVASWLDQDDFPTHLVRYEDMQAATAKVFQAAMDFAGHPVSSEDATRAARLSAFAGIQAQERDVGFREASMRAPSFFRRGESGAWRDELTAEQATRIEEQHGAMMDRLGYQRAFTAPSQDRI